MSRKYVTETIKIENAQIIFPNFRGEEKTFNPAGMRNFCVLLETPLANKLQEDGWNVRWLKPKDDQEDDQAYLQVSVRFDIMPPKIILITSEGQTPLTEETVGALDWAEKEEVDLVIRPHNWVQHEGTRNEKSGVKGYCKAMYVKIVEDEFAKKWATPFPDIAE